MARNKQIRNPKRWPPDKKLAETGYVKQLFDRIMSKKDRVSKRMANGKPIMDYRKPAVLSGKKENIDVEVLKIAESAVGVYKSKDCEVYVVSADLDFHVAEALRGEEHVWSGRDESLERLLSGIYVLFPKNKASQFKKKVKVTDMNVSELMAELERKKVKEMEYVKPRLPAADVTPEEVAAAHDPANIERERAEEEALNIQKSVGEIRA